MFTQGLQETEVVSGTPGIGVFHWILFLLKTVISLKYMQKCAVNLTVKQLNVFDSRKVINS